MQNWTELNFGCHAGSTLPQVALQNPGWVFWATRKGVCPWPLDGEAKEVAAKARAIRIPAPDGEELVADYVIDKVTGKFSHLVIVPASFDRDGIRLGCIDLSVPSGLSPFDKLGERLLLRAFKEIVFGSAGARITKRRAEEFFSDDRNFIL